MIISREVREVREVFILLSLLGDLEIYRFGDLEIFLIFLLTQRHKGTEFFDRINRIDKIRK